MRPFCKLADPDQYVAADWDLNADAAARAGWLDIFDEHTTSLVEHARKSLYPPPEEVLKRYAEEFRVLLMRIAGAPDKYAPLTINSLCLLRAEKMREFGLGDPYDRVKLDENVNALGLLGEVLRQLDAADPRQKVELHLRGVLAGNKFDLGAQETIVQFENGGIDFAATLAELPPRPWFVDNLDEIAERLAPGAVRYRKAIYFVDNAGGDVVLGAIPLARYLASEGCAVVLAANDHPALNDILVPELHDVLNHAGRVDPVIAAHVREGRISVVGTGCDSPMIDLSAVTAECNATAADADLLILEGMGRAVETNYSARFTCDTIHLAMIKNRLLARYLGCKLFDLIVGFTKAYERPRHAITPAGETR